MTLRSKILGSALTAAVMLGASAASATTIIKDLGPISGINPGVSLPFITLTKGNIYDFTFSLVAPLATDSTTSTQLQAQAQSAGVALPIGFKLFSGTPTGSNSLIATAAIASQAMLTEPLGLGSYFIQISGAEIAKSGEAPSGTVLTTAIPEPATWGVMLVGFGAIGASMRNARRRKVALTA
jgi:hypothetical protein